MRMVNQPVKRQVLNAGIAKVNIMKCGKMAKGGSTKLKSLFKGKDT